VFVLIYHIGGQLNHKELNNQLSIKFYINNHILLSFLIRPKVTNVTAEHMNSVLGSVLKLINNNIDAIEAPWMKRIAGKNFFFSSKYFYSNNYF
jgi:hypothetical protein